MEGGLLARLQLAGLPIGTRPPSAQGYWQERGLSRLQEAGWACELIDKVGIQNFLQSQMEADSE